MTFDLKHALGLSVRNAITISVKLILGYVDLE